MRSSGKFHANYSDHSYMSSVTTCPSESLNNSMSSYFNSGDIDNLRIKRTAGHTGFVAPDSVLPNESEHSIASSIPDSFLKDESQRSAGSDQSLCQHNNVNGFCEDCETKGLSCLWLGSTLLSACFTQNNSKDQEILKSQHGPFHPGASLLTTSRLLTMTSADELYEMLPETERLATPTLAFATYRDGWSMENFFEKTKDKEPVLLLIRSLKNSHVFGAFSTSRLSPPSRGIRGDGECFVFRLSGPPPATAYRWFRDPSMKKGPENRTSEQFLVVTREYIAFGASHLHGTNALRLDGDLLTCSSGPSDTYHSTTLTPGEEGPFQVRDIEVIQLGEKKQKRKGRGRSSKR